MAVLLTYLEAYVEVFTELGAATQLAVQTLVNKAVELIRAVTTVVLAVTQQCVINTVPVVTRIGCVITFLLCFSGTLEKGGKEKRNGSRDVDECGSDYVNVYKLNLIYKRKIDKPPPKTQISTLSFSLLYVWIIDATVEQLILDCSLSHII